MIAPPDDNDPESILFRVEVRAAVRWAVNEVMCSLPPVELHALGLLAAEALGDAVNRTAYAKRVGISRFKLLRAIPKLPKRVAHVLGIELPEPHVDYETFVELLVAAHHRSRVTPSNAD